MGVLTPHRALSLCWSRSGQKLHIPRAPQMFHGCTSQGFSNSAASPSSERQSLPLQRTRTGHKEWRRGGGRCGNLQPLFLNSFYSPTSSRVPKSTKSEELRGLGNFECSPLSQTLTPPHPQGPAPPLTGDDVGVVECCGWRAGEPSRLPEKQPGHCPDGRRWGSQDAGERAPQKSTRG